MMDRASMLDEVFRRAEGIQRRHTRRQVQLLGIAAFGLLFALFVMIGNLAGGASVRPTAMGAFLLGPEAGGYVIVALLAFALGIIVTKIIILKKSIQKMKNSTPMQEKDGER